jgi:ketosteroid isomerase-like protein
MLDSNRLEQIKKEVGAVVYAFFEAGKNKDVSALMNLHASSNLFSKFDASPPYTRQNSEEAFIYEQAIFANISDYKYKIDDLRIDVIERIAIATFYLTYDGVFVNDYSFEGTKVSAKSRVTMVLAKFEDEWKIVHEHLSSFPDFVARRNLEI